MNREQARTILWALGSPSSEDQRRDAVGVVLDLWQEQVITVEPLIMPSAAVVDAMHKRLAELDAQEKPSTPLPGSPRSMNEAEAEIERLRQLNVNYETKLAGWSKLWGRIEKLIGRELTSPESMIDRIAFLAEVERSRPTQQYVDELLVKLGNTATQRDDLLAAARAVIRAVDLADNDDVVIDLREVVAKINAREDT